LRADDLQRPGAAGATDYRRIPFDHAFWVSIQSVSGRGAPDRRRSAGAVRVWLGVNLKISGAHLLLPRASMEFSNVAAPGDVLRLNEIEMGTDDHCDTLTRRREAMIGSAASAPGRTTSDHHASRG
jgi:hypothetical protein